MKTAAFFILALFALLALPACGGDDDDSPPATPVPNDIQTADTQPWANLLLSVGCRTFS